jgi:hypothetical protein
VSEIGGDWIEAAEEEQNLTQRRRGAKTRKEAEKIPFLRLFAPLRLCAFALNSDSAHPHGSALEPLNAH